MTSKLQAMSAFEQMMLSRLDDEEKPQTCFGCGKISCKTCGEVVWERVSSSGGRYIKIVDGRCMRGIDIPRG